MCEIFYILANGTLKFSIGYFYLRVAIQRWHVWTIKLLLMSCRVMSKGVGMVTIHHLARQAKEAGVKLRAEFVSTDRNRQMLITYKFAGFKEVARNGDVMIMENNYSAIQPVPPYVKLIVE